MTQLEAVEAIIRAALAYANGADIDRAEQIWQAVEILKTDGQKELKTGRMKTHFTEYALDVQYAKGSSFFRVQSFDSLEKTITKQNEMIRDGAFRCEIIRREITELKHENKLPNT